MGATTAAALAAALQPLTGLTSLKVSKTLAVPDSVVAFSPALMGMRRLQVLDLASNPFSAQGTAAFAQALLALAGSLKHLDLSYCQIDASTAASTLAPALAQVTGLAKLHLVTSNFAPQGAQWLVPVLSNLRHLRKVDLDGCKLGAQGCMAVAQALKERDASALSLCCNGVASVSIDEHELLNMPGINVFV